MRVKYQKEMDFLKSGEREIEIKQQELKETVCEKISCDNKYSIENLIKFINDSISLLNSEKMKITSDFLSKKSDFYTYCESIKSPAIKYHSMMIVKEKLYQFKIERDQTNQ